MLTEEHRDKIRKSNIFSNLIQHAEGKKDLSPTQVQVGLALIKKILPDLQSVQISGDEEKPFVVEHKLTEAKETFLAAIAQSDDTSGTGEDR